VPNPNALVAISKDMWTVKLCYVAYRLACVMAMEWLYVFMCCIISDMARTFELEPENVTAYLGDVVMFSCKIAGVPRPSIVWVKDDYEISTSNTNFVVHQEDGILEIRSVQFPDFGRYR